MLKRVGGAGAAAALGAGLAGCVRKPERKIVSLAEMPEYMKPGEPLTYASTWTEGAFPYGMLVKTVDGRPIKIEGNPRHPINRGASSAQMQSACMSLYDPGRLRSPMRGGAAITWDEADKRIVAALREAKSVVLVTRATLGPSERALIRKFQEIKPGARHIVWESVHDMTRRGAWKKIYGADGEFIPRYDKAKIILSLGSDFLGTDGVTLEAIRRFADGRVPTPQRPEMSRLYVIEEAVTLTGANADHRLAMRPSQALFVAQALLMAVRAGAGAMGGMDEMDAVAKQSQLDERVLKALAGDLAAHEREAVVVAGPHHPEAVHAAVALLNDVLAAPGATLDWNPQPATLPVNDPIELKAAMTGGADLVLLFGVDPVYDYPDYDLWERVKKDRTAGKIQLVSHSEFPDSTSNLYSFSLPSAHNLESWNDAAPRPGILSLCQPVIAPLYGGRQEADLLLAWARALAQDRSDRPDKLDEYDDFHDFIRARWEREIYPASGSLDSFDEFWEGALREGVVIRPAPSDPPRLDAAQAAALIRAAVPVPLDDGKFEIVARPHYALYDGRFGAVAWLHELPDPITQEVWGAAAAISPATAAKLDAATQDADRYYPGLRAKDLFHVQRGMADDVIALAIGTGRLWLPPGQWARGHDLACEFGSGYSSERALLELDKISPYLATGADVRIRPGTKQLNGRWVSDLNIEIQNVKGRAYGWHCCGAQNPRELQRVVRTQTEFSMQGRPVVLEGTIEEYKREPSFVQRLRHTPEPAPISTGFDYTPRNRWGMAIDLNRCVACGACVVACQAENNGPPVGRDQCARGRRMHWLRVDTYILDAPDAATNPAFRHIPIMCQHCENAPCENVCPVAATTHSPEGLNEQVYNRCVGTRYCMNNCPYKVRRFNFYDFQQRFIGGKKGLLDYIRYRKEAVATDLKGPQRLAYNPQVSVRSIGVMEKCTYCVQRITAARYVARQKGLKFISDETLQTACQQACPAGAIVFGDLNDPGSRVAKLAASERAYRLFEELNVQNRTVYLAKITNAALQEIQHSIINKEQGMSKEEDNRQHSTRNKE